MSQMKKMLGLILVMSFAAASGVAYSQSSSLTDELKARIAPVGSLCKSGESCAAAPVAVSTGPKSGKEVFESTCTNCHTAGVAGAPKFGNHGDWAPRIDKGIETLYTHALHGFNSMPAKGLCMSCSDEEVEAAVDYMIEASK